MFQNKNQNLGRIVEGCTIVVFYPYTNISAIQKTIASCGCTSVVANQAESRLEVTYKAPGVPPHLIGQGWMNIKQSIEVYFTSLDDTEHPQKDKLDFEAIVTKRQWT